jgi:3-oxo-5alpha-steroid 4-dehydrogenase
MSTLSPYQIESALKVPDSSALEWQRQTDVLVVGFGGAGACAAIEAFDHGGNTLIIDRFDGGGATAYSGGIHYAGGTRFQKEAGYDDTAEEMYKYLSLEVGDAVTDETLRRFCNESRANLEWLEGLGVPFASTTHIGKTVYPPDGKFLYFSGQEAMTGYKDKALAAPRGHRVVGNGYTGHIYFDVLRRVVKSRGIPVMRHSRVVRLVVDSSDRVVGVEALVLPETAWKKHRSLYSRAVPLPFNYARAQRAIAQNSKLESRCGRREFIRARNGVILATGAFTFNTEMLRQNVPKYAQHTVAYARMGSMGCDGSGIQMGKSVGGRAAKLDQAYYARLISPPSALVDGIVVNRLGQRFINEESYGSVLGSAIANQPDSEAWLILDSATFRKMLRQLIPKGDGQFLQWYLPVIGNLLFGGTRRARTLEGLARKCGINTSNLEKEVARMRSDAAQSLPDHIGKTEKYNHIPGTGPYWAINCSVANKFQVSPFFTLGGLAVNERTGQVLNRNGAPILGLYAAGRAAIGVCANSYFSGMSLADGVFSGRRAGAHCTMTAGASVNSDDARQRHAV